MKLIKYGIVIISFCFPIAAVNVFAAEDYLPPDKNSSHSQPTQRHAKTHIYTISATDLNMQKCIKNCLYNNQMVAMAIELIEQQCRQDCQYKQALQLSRSSNKEQRIAGVKALCASNDVRAVQPLIKALKRDLQERTGVWAWIIPALGSLRDTSAVPILIDTLTIMDDDWLGREMSAQALGSIGDPAAVKPLLAAAWRADTRDHAIEALAKFHDARVIPVLLSALDPGEEQQTREAAISGLSKLGTLAVPAMIEAFSNVSPEYPDTEKRLLLCQLLAASGDPHALKALHKSITDTDKAIRNCAQKHIESGYK